MLTNCSALKLYPFWSCCHLILTIWLQQLHLRTCKLRSSFIVFAGVLAEPIVSNSQKFFQTYTSTGTFFKWQSMLGSSPNRNCKAIYVCTREKHLSRFEVRNDISLTVIVCIVCSRWSVNFKLEVSKLVQIREVSLLPHFHSNRHNKQRSLAYIASLCLES